MTMNHYMRLIDEAAAAWEKCRTDLPIEECRELILSVPDIYEQAKQLYQDWYDIEAEECRKIYGPFGVHTHRPSLNDFLKEFPYAEVADYGSAGRFAKVKLIDGEFN